MAWGALAVGALIPAALPPGPQAWRMVGDRYGQWGQTPEQVVAGVLGHLLEAARLLVGPPVRGALSALACLPVLDPLALLASAPLVAVHALSRFGDQASLWGYYALPALALWLLGAARGLQRLRRVSDALVVSLALLPLAVGPFTFAVTWPTAEDSAARATLASLGAREAVAAQNALVPHLPVSDAVRPLERWADASVVVVRPGANAWPLDAAGLGALVERLVEREGFGVDSATRALVVLRRGAPRERVGEVLGWFREAP